MQDRTQRMRELAEAQGLLFRGMRAKRGEAAARRRQARYHKGTAGQMAMFGKPQRKPSTKKINIKTARDKALKRFENILDDLKTAKRHGIEKAADEMSHIRGELTYFKRVMNENEWRRIDKLDLPEMEEFDKRLYQDILDELTEVDNLLKFSEQTSGLLLKRAVEKVSQSRTKAARAAKGARPEAQPKAEPVPQIHVPKITSASIKKQLDKERWGPGFMPGAGARPDYAVTQRSIEVVPGVEVREIRPTRFVKKTQEYKPKGPKTALFKVLEYWGTNAPQRWTSTAFRDLGSAASYIKDIAPEKMAIARKEGWG